MTPFKTEDIGLRTPMKGTFPVQRCSDPFALTGLPRTFENFRKALPSLEVDDAECMIMSEKVFISPKACEQYGDYSLQFTV